jgi:hypothetical protein
MATRVSPFRVAGAANRVMTRVLAADKRFTASDSRRLIRQWLPRQLKSCVSNNDVVTRLWERQLLAFTV